MKSFHAFLSTFVIALVLPGVAFGSDCGTAEALCGATKDSVKNLISDAKCKSDASCVDCVASNVLGSQQGAQCDGMKSSKKSSTTQVISASLYTATGIVCGVACAITMIPGYGTSQTQTMSRLCGGLGLVTAVSDVGFALASNDIAGGLMGSIGGIATASANLKLVKGATSAMQGATQAVGKEATKEASKKAKSNVCINTAVYLGTGIIKSLSVMKMKKSQEKSCSIVTSLASAANSPVQACLASAGATNTNQSAAMAGIFSATPETFTTVTTDDVNRQEAVAGTAGQFMKDMKGDLDAAMASGNLNLADIAKRIESGEDVSAIAAGAGLPSQITDPLKEFEAKAKAGETSNLLASLSGGTGGYSSSGHKVASTETGGGFGDFSFGGGASGAAPGEGAASLDIDRKPAEAKAGMENDGDVFHGSFAGSIFDIVTYRLKEQKGNYAELDPEGRMNRVFNGYGDPKAAARKPASVKEKGSK